MGAEPKLSTRKRATPQPGGGTRLPLWLINLLFFGFLILVVLGYFFWQADQVKNSFYHHTREHSQLLAQITRLNLDNALAADQAVKQAARTFMLNSARFIDYLAAIEPFNENELSNLALESGLRGITIITDSGLVSGPPQWLKECHISRQMLNHLQAPGFAHLPESHIFVLSYLRREGPGSIFLGFGARHLEKLQQQVGLKHLLKTLNQVPGIAYIRIEPAKASQPKENIRELKTPEGMVIESRLPLNGQYLVAGFNSNFLLLREQALWRDFFIFAGILGVLGLLASVLLYRLQLAYLTRVRRFEQHLARERENALLGRATAALAHEIRNPLNAINIGLQRLELEECGLRDEYSDLISAMRNAVGRADSILNNLRRFSRPLEPHLETIDIRPLIEDILALYRLRAESAGIEISLKDLRPAGERKKTALDTDLMAQVFENLCKNAIEAQPEGGFLHIELRIINNNLIIRLENDGLEITPGEVRKIVTPWFTTKTRGTGLGLALVERIVRAHRGEFSVSSPKPGRLRQEIILPTS